MRRRVLFALLLVAGFLPLGAEEGRRYVVIYTTNVLNPNVQTAMICFDNHPNCNNVYETVERMVSFSSMKEVVSFLNNRESRCTTGQGFSTFILPSTCQFGPMKREDFIGVYKLIPVTVGQVKVGTEKKSVTKTVEEDVDKMEWQENP